MAADNVVGRRDPDACTDLSQAGRTKGITGEAMRFLVQELEELGYRWAYRLVASRFTGVPQRRQRVILLASTEGDPHEVLFADDAGEPPDDHYRDGLAGFHWTEGPLGLGWARDAVPTLEAGSTIGIPSPPAIWNPSARKGERIITPALTEAEQMQGFEAEWTTAAESVSRRKGTRWKLVGNAVTVGVSEWVAGRLVRPGSIGCEMRELAPEDPWPTAACGAGGRRWAVHASMWPVRQPYVHLDQIVDLRAPRPLAVRGAAGFYDRATRGSLRFAEGFLDDVAEHIDHVAAA